MDLETKDLSGSLPNGNSLAGTLAVSFVSHCLKVDAGFVVSCWNDLVYEHIGEPGFRVSPPTVSDVASQYSRLAANSSAATITQVSSLVALCGRASLSELAAVSCLPARVKQQTIVRELNGITVLDLNVGSGHNYVRGNDGRPAHVYYASYGSNLTQARFNMYLFGGKLAGTERTYEGARNKVAPTEDVPLVLPGTLFFAGQSTVWKAGVAFLDTNSAGHTLGRAYRITVNYLPLKGEASR